MREPIRSRPSTPSAESPSSVRRYLVRRASRVVALALLTACGSKADLVIEGGPVWTGLATGRGRAGAVAIAEGKILAVGDSAEIARYMGSGTQVLDGEGALRMRRVGVAHRPF